MFCNLVYGRLGLGERIEGALGVGEFFCVGGGRKFRIPYEFVFVKCVLHEERAQTAGGLSGGFLKALLRIGIGLDAVALDRVYGYENARRIRRFRGLSEALAREHKGERHDKWEYVSHNMMEIFFRHVNARTPFYKEKNV